MEWLRNSRYLQVALAAVFGMFIYNPYYSLVHFVIDVVGDGLGVVDNVAWYLQPVGWGLGAVGLILGYSFYKKLDVANRERPYFIIALLGVVVVNGLILAVDAVWFNGDLFSLRWVEWQILPALMACLMFAATQPKARLKQFGARSINTEVEVTDGSPEQEG